MAQQGRKITEEKRQQIIAHYIDCQNYSETARKFKTSASSVKKYVDDNEDVARVLSEKKQELTESFEDWLKNQAENRKKTMRNIIDAIENKSLNPDMFTNIKDLAMAYGILFDKEYKPKEFAQKERELRLKERLGNDLEALGVQKMDAILEGFAEQAKEYSKTKKAEETPNK